MTSINAYNTYNFQSMAADKNIEQFRACPKFQRVRERERETQGIKVKELCAAVRLSADEKNCRCCCHNIGKAREEHHTEWGDNFHIICELELFT